MITVLAIVGGLFLAFANGANDNFKGVATLLGSRTTSYTKALAWATVCTLLGSFAALLLAKGLIATFSGKGLVPDVLVGSVSFSVSVLIASAFTVIFATRLGFPVSTTHALTGALVGVGWMASAAGVNLSKLGGSFFLPLIVSPILATLSATAVYPILSKLRRKAGIERESCFCIAAPVVSRLASVGYDQALTISSPVLTPTSGPSLRLGTAKECRDQYTGRVMGIRAEGALTLLHFASAGVVSFARGLNDTPKIAAMLLLGGAVSPALTIIMVAAAMATGGLTGARKVAETMAHRVSDMNAGQGFTANLVTAVIVIFASKLGLPVSTTHVSCGAIFGIGAVTRKAQWKTITTILAAWITTLPLAAVLGALVFVMMSKII